MSKIKFISALLFIWVFLPLQAGIEKDIPHKGEYVFFLKKIWQVDSTGNQLLGNITNIWIDDGDKMILKSYKPLLKTSMTGVNHVLLGTGARCLEEKHLQTIEGL